MQFTDITSSAQYCCRKENQKQYISVLLTFRWALTSLSLCDMKAHYTHDNCRISPSASLWSQLHYVLMNSSTQGRAWLNGELFSAGRFPKTWPHLPLQDRRNLTNLDVIIAALWMLPLHNSHLPSILLACTLSLAPSMFVNLTGKFWKDWKKDLIAHWDANGLQRKMVPPKTRCLGHLPHAFTSF